jgi:hypothetical protein
MGAIKDLVFGLGLKSATFDNGMHSAGAELRKLAGMRLDGLRKELAALGKDGQSLSKTKFRGLMQEYRLLQQTMKNTEDHAKKLNHELHGEQGKHARHGESIFGEMLKLEVLKEGLRLAMDVFREAGATAAEAFKLSFEGKHVDEGLKNALEKIGQGEDFEKIEQFSMKIERAFKIGHDDAKQGFTTLIQGGMDAAQAMKSAALAADIAKAKKMTFQESSLLITRAFNGEMRALKQLGIFVAETGDKAKDGAAAMAELQKRFGGFAGAAAAASSPMESLKLAFADTLQMIGDKMVPIVMPMMQGISDWLNEIVSNGSMSAWLEGLIDGFKTAFGWALSMFTTIKTYAIGIFDFFAQIGPKLAATFQDGSLATAVFSVLGGILTAVGKLAWEALKAIGTLAVSRIMNGLPALFAAVAKFITDGLRSVIGPRLSSYLGLDMSSKALGEFTAEHAQNHVDVGKQVFKDFAGKIPGIAADLRDTAQIGGSFISEKLGGSASMAQARQQVAQAGPGFIDGLRNTAEAGRQRRIQDAADIYGASGSVGVSARAQAMSKANKQGGKLAQLAENNNAHAENRVPQKLEIGLAVTSLDGSMHPSYATG